MISAKYFEDYEVGTQRVTSGRTVTEADVVFHAGHTGDFYPHHMDAEWCRTQPFGQRICHGTMIFSIGIGLTAGEINPHAMSYGYDKLRFVKPVFINDTIRTEVAIEEKRAAEARPGYGFVVEACKVLNQHDAVVLVCKHLLLVERSNKS